jgi:hypothetical protein
MATTQPVVASFGRIGSANGDARLDGDARVACPQAAGAIHTDFERGFIRAETIAYDDYVAGKGEAGARDAGKRGSKARVTWSPTATCCISGLRRK